MRTTTRTHAQPAATLLVTTTTARAAAAASVSTAAAASVLFKQGLATVLGRCWWFVCGASVPCVPTTTLQHLRRGMALALGTLVVVKNYQNLVDPNSVFQEDVAVRGTGAGTAIPPLPPRAASCPRIGNSVISTSPSRSNAPSTGGSPEPTTRTSSEPSTIASSSQPPSASPSTVPSGVPSFFLRPSISTEPTLSSEPTTRNSSEPSHIPSSSRRPPFSSQPSYIEPPTSYQPFSPFETPSVAARFDDDDNYEDDDDDNFDDDDEEDYYVDDDEEDDDDDDEVDDDDDDSASNYGTTNYAGISALDRAKQTIAEKEQAIEQQIASNGGFKDTFKDPNTGVVVAPASMSDEVKYAAIGKYRRGAFAPVGVSGVQILLQNDTYETRRVRGTQFEGSDN